MSIRDFQEYGTPLSMFSGRAFELTLATNSIKLRFDPEHHNHRYVWIDPPWVVDRAGAVIASGADCPDPAEPEYEKQYQSWCDRVSTLLKETQIDAVSCDPDGTVSLRLSRGLRLMLLSGLNERPEGYWYDDWYAKLDDA